MSLLTSIKTFTKAVGKVAVAHSPWICTGLAVLGVGGIVFSTAKSTKKIVKAVEAAEKKKGKKLTKKEFLKEAVKPAIPTIIVTVATIILIFGAQKCASKKLKTTAMLMSSAIASKDALIDELTKRTEENVVKEAKKAAADKRAKDILSGKSGTIATQKDGDYEKTGEGDEKVIDLFTGRRFLSSEKALENAELRLQSIYHDNCGFCNHADLYDLLHLEEWEMGEELYWTDECCSDRNPDKGPSLNIGSTIIDGIPHLTIMYVPNAISGYHV